MRLTTMTQITLDGVVQGNGGASDEDRRGGFERGGWGRGAGDASTRDLISDTIRRAAAFLFGRRTYELFLASWGTIPDLVDSPAGQALQDRPKYVASSTMTDPTWQHSSVLTGDLETAIRALKAEGDGEVQVHGSGTLVAWLLAHRLVDELTLLHVPVIVGQGKRLFPEAGPDLALDLVDSHVDTKGVMVATYRPSERSPYWTGGPGAAPAADDARED